MASDVITMFDQLAAEYDSWYQTSLGSLADALEREAVLGLAGAVNGRIALDASCGTGHYALALARRGARVTAVNVSAPMLSLARKKAQQAELPLAPVRAALEHPPFRPGSFDLIICVLALEFVADPAAVVAELARLQPPGGRLVIGVLGRFSFWALWRRLKGLFQPLLWQRARFFSRKAAVSLLRAAGYQTVVERQAIYFPPVNSAGALAVLRRLEGAGRRWTPGTAAFLVVSGIRDGRRGL